jgi:Protein of unknown function (DUF2917)
MNTSAQKATATSSHHNLDGTPLHANFKLDPGGETMNLHNGQHLSLRRAAGWTVRALSGAVWITQDGDIRDVVLQAGQSFVLDRPTTALLTPLAETRVSISCIPCTRRTPSRGLGVLQGLLRGFAPASASVA